MLNSNNGFNPFYNRNINKDNQKQAVLSFFLPLCLSSKINPINIKEFNEDIRNNDRLRTGMTFAGLVKNQNNDDDNNFLLPKSSENLEFVNETVDPIQNDHTSVPVNNPQDEESSSLLPATEQSMGHTNLIVSDNVPKNDTSLLAYDNFHLVVLNPVEVACSRSIYYNLERSNGSIGNDNRAAQQNYNNVSKNRIKKYIRNRCDHTKIDKCIVAWIIGVLILTIMGVLVIVDPLNADGDNKGMINYNETSLPGYH